MKTKLIGLSIVIAITMLLNGCGQPRVAKSELVYTKVIEHNKNADEAYQLSKMWLAETFNDSKAVIEYDNKENFNIIGRGILPKVNYGFMVYGDTKFTIKISNKDNKSRIVMDNISITTWDKMNGKLHYDMWNLGQFKVFTEEANILTSEFKAYIVNDKQDTDW